MPAEATTIGGEQGSGILGTALRRLIREKLGSDSSWCRFAGSGAWICPYCLSAVRSASAGHAALVSAIEEHLESECGPYRSGTGCCDGRPRAERDTRRRVRGKTVPTMTQVGRLATSDPAWLVFDEEEFWYCPFEGVRARDVALHRGRVDPVVYERMATHLERCPCWGEPPRSSEELERIRDEGRRARALARELAGLVDQPFWRHRSGRGEWVCPFCLGLVPSVVVAGEADWNAALEGMATHLVGCKEFEASRQAIPAPSLRSEPSPRRADGPVLPGFEFATAHRPGSEVGGDFHLIVEQDGGRLAIALGHASGRGKDAERALFVARNRLVRLAAELSEPADVLAALNDDLLGEGGGPCLMSASLVRIDAATRGLSWVRAGHNPLVAWRCDEPGCRVVVPPGTVLGLREGAWFRSKIVAERFPVEAGDRFLLFGHGLLQDEAYGVDRLLDVVSALGDRPLDEILEAILDDADRVRGTSEAPVDRRLIAFGATGPL